MSKLENKLFRSVSKRFTDLGIPKDILDDPQMRHGFDEFVLGGAVMWVKDKSPTRLDIRFIEHSYND